MSGLDINVSPEKLAAIRDYVDDFQKNINGACSELEDEAKKLQANNSAEEISDILKTVDEIKEIISSSQETFKELKEKIGSYITFIAKVKSIAKRQTVSSPSVLLL